MLKEFAVDPSVIASSFETCRFLINQFGADKGRLISKFPKNWKKRAIDAADELPDGFQKERVIEYLSGIGNDWLTFIASNRPFAAPGDSWLSNAISAHAQKPFAGIVCDREDRDGCLINVQTCDPGAPPFSARRMDRVDRTADALSEAAAMLLQSCRRLRLVDPYFDPGRSKWSRSLAAMLAYIPDITRVECEYHIEEREDSPSTEMLKQRLRRLNAVIPTGGQLRLVRWKERSGGERFHGRYVLTENAGLNYEGGLDVEVGANQTTGVSLLDREQHASLWSDYELTSQVYELITPVLVVDSQGDVHEVER